MFLLCLRLLREIMLSKQDIWKCHYSTGEYEIMVSILNRSFKALVYWSLNEEEVSLSQRFVHPLTSKGQTKWSEEPTFTLSSLSFCTVWVFLQEHVRLL